MNKKIEFTGSEVEILQLVADGFTNDEIARLLSLNENSVNDHCRRMKQKTGAIDTPDLVRITSSAGCLNKFPEQLKKHYSVPGGRDSEQAAPQNFIQRFVNNNLPAIMKFFSYDDLLRKTIIFLGTCVMLLGAIMAKSEPAQPGPANISVQELKVDMGSLLEENIALTRAVIFCIVDERPGIDSIVHEVVKNQGTTAALIKRYYGDEAGKEFAKLLYKNITLAADVMIAYRKGHKGAYEKADEKWQESADEIVAFLTQANPSYKLFGIRKLMDDEMKYTVDEMAAIKNKDNAGCDAAYDKARTVALEIANTLAESIVQHFPERFQNVEMAPPSYGVK